MKKALAIFMAVVVVCCVYGYGGNERFSFEVYLTNIAEQFAEIPTIQGLVDIWNTDANALAVALSDTTENYDVVVMAEDGGDTERTGFFEKVKAFLQNIVDLIKGIGDFIVKLWDSVLYLVSMLVAIFEVLPCLLPWNATVTIE